MPSRWLRLSVLGLRVVCAAGGAALWILWFVRVEANPIASLQMWAAALVLLGAALWRSWPILAPGRWTVVAALAVAAGLLPRLLGLDTAPYGVTLDEVIAPYLGLQMLQERPWELFSGASDYFRIPYLTMGLQSWPVLFVEPLYGARLSSALVSVLSIAATYCLGARLVGSAAGAFAAIVMAASSWHIVYARTAYPYVQAVLFVPIAVHLAVLGDLLRNRFLQYLCGVVMAVCMLTYTSGRLAFLVVPVWMLHRLIFGRVGLRDALTGAMATALVAAVALSPWLRNAGLEAILLRYRETSMGPTGPLQQMAQHGWFSREALDVVQSQVAAAASIYWTATAQVSPHEYFKAAVLDPVSLCLVVVGIALCAVRPRDSRRFVLLGWIAAAFVVGQVLTDVPTAGYRAAAGLPALAICAGLAAHTLVERARVWIGHRAAVESAAVVALVAAVVPINLLHVKQYIDGRSDDPLGGMARFIATQPLQPIYYLIAGWESLAEHQVFRFLAPRHRLVDSRSLIDLLGHIDSRYPAEFVIAPTMEGTELAIRRCYPGAVLRTAESPVPEHPILSLYVSQDAVAAGKNCVVPPEGPGLRARYFSGASWDGDVILERLEDWPLRWNVPQAGRPAHSIEWSGRLRLASPGEYRFRLATMNANAFATIGSSVNLDLYEGQAPTEARVKSPGGVESFRLRCRPLNPNGWCHLLWAPPGAEFGLVEPQFLLPPATED